MDELFDEIYIPNAVFKEATIKWKRKADVIEGWGNHRTLGTTDVRANSRWLKEVVLEMSEITEKVIQEIKNRIVDYFQPEKIILFGSYGYGKPRIDSDVDLLIIKEDVKSKRKEAVRIRKILRGLKKSFDIIVTTPKEFEFYGKEWINSVFAEAGEKGAIIYERA